MTEPHSANELPTPGHTVGPFYGFALPYERGNELAPPWVPGGVRLHGAVFDGAGETVPDALVEIRQAGPDGVVPRVEGSLVRNGTDFTGWGRCSTDPAGRYTFSTLRPGPPPAGGAAFFSVVVFARGLLDRLFTRAYLAGQDAELADDAFFSSLGPAQRDSLLIKSENDRDLQFDIHLQGESQTTFLSFNGVS